MKRFFFFLFLLTQNGSLPVASTCKCFVDVGHCQVPLFIEGRDVANAKTADPRRSSYKNLSKLMEKKKRRDDQKRNIEPCGIQRGGVRQSGLIRTHADVSLSFHSLGAAAKIHIQGNNNKRSNGERERDEPESI